MAAEAPRNAPEMFARDARRPPAALPPAFGPTGAQTNLAAFERAEKNIRAT